LTRRLLNIAAGISLALCIVAAALWVRSYRVGDGFVWKPSDAEGTYYRAYFGCGGARVGRGEYTFDHAAYFDHYPDRPPTRPAGYHPGTFADRLGFDYHSGSDSKGMPVADLFFPIWLVVLGAAVLPGYRITSLWRGSRSRRRLMSGRCVSCGYDLRVTPARCPECGAVPATDPKTPHDPPPERTVPAV
jgi:hypothetical protein